MNKMPALKGSGEVRYHSSGDSVIHSSRRQEQRRITYLDLRGLGSLLEGGSVTPSVQSSRTSGTWVFTGYGFFPRPFLWVLGLFPYFCPRRALPPAGPAFPFPSPGWEASGSRCCPLVGRLQRGLPCCFWIPIFELSP